MGIFQKRPFSYQKKKDIPGGLWEKCPECNNVIHNLELTQNQRVCPKCDYHFTQTAWERLEHFLDPGTFEELDGGMLSVDALKFRGLVTYPDTLKKHQKRTGLKEAVICGTGRLLGGKISIAVMDFNFLAATMGSVVGEKITRAIERGTRERLPVITIAASGGARVYEGMLSLMQMAKTSGALACTPQAGLPYISVLTNSTMAGVMASFASLGDLIVAEPRCAIGFAGARVIRETTHQELPPGFQTAEFLEEHGLIDMIVHRKRMRATLAEVLKYLAPKNPLS